MSETIQVYVVEDSPTQALGVKRALLQLPQLEVTLFHDGLEAYRAVQRNQPGLLLMDLILPSLHGLALCRLLKFHLDYKHIPLLIFSSITESDIAEQARRAGADDFLAKPFDPAELVERVRALLAKVTAS
ncbi:MAG: response regulator [Candidatus Eremiobacteraeota bacterium]|nr:response regulator [Candidatus Eremiobacteraeota bacterium]MCW5872142.1 response regulator [Candidatus Eremiobacteraeota bacterium]